MVETVPELVTKKIESADVSTDTIPQPQSVYNQLLISLFERSSLGIVLFDQKGSILALNNSFKEILDLPDDTSEIVYFTDLCSLFPDLFRRKKDQITILTLMPLTIAS
ncbi:MAG: PAS domain-containing protein [Ignavibacteriales bacterium]|nr:PAS domain-containing protein [Ignavibacteriales bacterium]